MKTITKASEVFKEDEYEIIFIPDSLCEEIDEAIKQINSYHDRDHFVSSAIEKFVSDISEEKNSKNDKKISKD